MATRFSLADLGLDLKRVPDLADAGTRKRLSRSAIEAFFAIADKWNLKNEEARALFGGVSNGRFYALKRQRTGVLTQDELTRVSLLIGIFKALNILFGEALADSWISRPNSNPLFQDSPPVLFMERAGLPGFIAVRRLLDSRRGGQ